MNLILTGICVGMTLLVVIIMHNLQKGILKILLCCKRDDRILAPIIMKRLDTSRVQNTKIAMMVTASIAFLMFQTGAQETSMAYF